MIKLVILDVDGVLTDGKKYYNRDGDVLMKTFCDKDWTAIKRFKALGIKVLFLSGDPFNEKIAKNRNQTMNSLISDLDKKRQGNLSSAIRLFVLREVQLESEE